MLNSHRHRENGKKEVTGVPSADYLKTAVYFWSMFQETGKTTGWGWDGNKRGTEIWQQAKLLPRVKTQPAPSTPLLSVVSRGKQKILESRHTWTPDRASSPQQRGRKVVWSFGWGFFWDREVARTSEVTKGNLSSKVTSRIWSWLQWKCNCLQQRKSLERNNPEPTGVTHRSCVATPGDCQTLLQPHHYWHHSAPVRGGSEHVQNSTTKSPCWRNVTHSQHGIIVLWGTRSQPCHENWR